MTECIGPVKRREQYLNTSLAKALTLLGCFDGEEHELSLTELAERMGTAPGSIYSIMHTLERFGYVDRDPSTKRYRLGLRILVHANCVLSGLDVREQARPVLKRLARELDANVHLAVLHDKRVLYLDREEAAPTVIIKSVIGRLVPLHCTALGKVFLAYDPDLAKQICRRSVLTAVTPWTITSPAVLKEELPLVRERGYAVDLQEFHVGNSCVAAPVFDFRKAVMVAISASFISSRLEHEPLDRFAAAIVAGAQEVSLAMGCPP